MVAWSIRRALAAVPLLAGVLALAFLLLEIAPGDACDAMIDPEMRPETVAALRRAFGCDRPALERFLAQAASLARLDFGVSLTRHRAAIDVVAEALPNTLILSGTMLAVSQLAGMAIGTVQAVWHRRAPDVALSVATLVLWSVPGFWLAVLLLRAFTLWWPVLPSSGMVDPVVHDALSPVGKLGDRLAHLVLPGLAMGLAGSAVEARFVRASMVEALSADHVRAARARGLPEARVVLIHAGRVALGPLAALLGLGLPGLVSGSVFVELIFAWPGMGRLMVDAIRAEDVPLLLACFAVYTLVVVLGGVVADVLHAALDPRVRLEG